MLTTLINVICAITILQGTEPPARHLKNVTVSYGTYKDKISLKWEKANCTSYTVLRSKFKNELFEPVASTSETFYDDTSIENGIKYWYKVVPESDLPLDMDDSLFLTDEEYLNTSENKLPVYKDKPAAEKKQASILNTDLQNLQLFNYSGFTIPEKPAPLKLEDLIKMKKSILKTPSNNNEKIKQNKQLEYLKQFYMNPVKFSLVMNFARPYLDKNELVIISGFSSYDIVKEKNLVNFYDSSMKSLAVFESKKLLKIIRESNDPGLNDLILNNSELFCVANGITEIKDKLGVTRIVYSYDVVGLSTRFLKDDKEWKSRTIMLSTSRPDLKDKLMKASKPLE